MCWLATRFCIGAVLFGINVPLYSCNNWATGTQEWSYGALERVKPSGMVNSPMLTKHCPTCSDILQSASGQRRSTFPKPPTKYQDYQGPVELPFLQYYPRERMATVRLLQKKYKIQPTASRLRVRLTFRAQTGRVYLSVLAEAANELPCLSVGRSLVGWLTKQPELQIQPSLAASGLTCPIQHTHAERRPPSLRRNTANPQTQRPTI